MISVVIQAGGESRRMGQDKALLLFLGRPLISRVIERMLPIASEILVTTNQPENYRFLGLPLFKDIYPGRGALGGLYTALHAAQNPVVAVVACDMPFASPDLMALAQDRLLETGADAVIPSTTSGLEPLHAVYRRETCLPLVKEAVEAGKWRLISWFPAARVTILKPDEVLRIDPDRLAFWNLNTPEELRLAEELAGKGA
jgi:molybdopterin-guanine dinucleotide biosynthesis protein A